MRKALSVLEIKIPLPQLNLCGRKTPDLTPRQLLAGLFLRLARSRGVTNALSGDAAWLNASSSSSSGLPCRGVGAAVRAALPLLKSSLFCWAGTGGLLSLVAGVAFFSARRTLWCRLRRAGPSPALTQIQSVTEGRPKKTPPKRAVTDYCRCVSAPCDRLILCAAGTLYTHPFLTKPSRPVGSLWAEVACLAGARP